MSAPAPGRGRDAADQIKRQSQNRLSAPIRLAQPRQRHLTTRQRLLARAVAATFFARSREPDDVI
jgi:hypothetical protein